MAKSLVIVESPAKAKTINKYLGKDFVVKSSVGHVRDLPVSGGGSKVDPKERAKQAALTRKMPPEERAAYKKAKTQASLIARMGIDPANDWNATYQVLPDKEKVINELKKLAKDADHIYLATDLDREGEAIAWHLREVIGGDDTRYSRVVFNEITKTAINQAFETPGELDMDRVEAQQARRFLDRVVGYMVSPLLWAKIARGLSAGRVQSVAVRLVVSREREIRIFIPDEYWEIHADTTTHNAEAMRLQLTHYQGKEFKPTNEEQTMVAVDAIKAAPWTVTKREDRPTSSKPSAPFITSTLQQAASTRLSFSVKKTMMMAQRLYEAGYITYMRTDSTNLSKDAVAAAREFIGDQYGKPYLPKDAILYGSKAGAQEAHEAIRPSDVNVSSDDVTGLDPDASRLYDLIWRQFVACQMVPAKYLSSTISVDSAGYLLKIKGRILQFDGYTKVQPPMGRKGQEDVVLPDVKEGQELNLEKVDPSQHFTKPAPRYTEASLVKELEKQGIGRPSTYASIISTIQDRGYVRLEGRRFYAEKMGDIVTDRLVENFSDLMDYSFTASMESRLDEVAEGKLAWKTVLNDFFKGFRAQLSEAEGDGEGKQGLDGMRANIPTETDIECPTCQRLMQIRTGATGVFLGCSGYALKPKERCTTTMNLIPGDEAVSADADEDAEARAQAAKRRCSICSTAMDSYLIDEQRKLHVCGNNPDCLGFEVETGEFKIKGYDGPVLDCDKCGAEMQLKSGRFGKYFGCMECKNTRKLLRSGDPAPPKADPIKMENLKCQKVDDYYLLRDGASGIFLAASQFPRNRETRAPLVKELKSVADQLDPKFEYLTKAPVKDGEGNPTIIRYSRKTKTQYVMTEVEGKATKWKATYDGKRWVVEDKSKK